MPWLVTHNVSQIFNKVKHSQAVPGCALHAMRGTRLGVVDNPVAGGAQERGQWNADWSAPNRSKKEAAYSFEQVSKFFNKVQSAQAKPHDTQVAVLGSAPLVIRQSAGRKRGKNGASA